MSAYGNNFAELLIELDRVRDLVMLGVTSAREIESREIFQHGRAISSNELDYLMNQPFAIPAWAMEYPEAKQELIEKRANYAEDSRLFGLKRLFNLSDVEVDILLLCLICELDFHCQELYGYLQNNISKRHPSVDLILNLLSSATQEKLVLFNQCFTPNSPLFQNCLLIGGESNFLIEGISLNSTLKLNQPIAHYLLERDGIAPFLSTIAKLLVPTKSLDELKLNDDIRQQTYKLIESCSALQVDIAAYDMMITLRGTAGSGRRTLAKAICKDLVFKLLAVDIEDLLSYKLDQWHTLLPLIKQEAKLQNTPIYWLNLHSLSVKDNNKCHLNLFTSYLEDFPWMHFFAQLPLEYFPLSHPKGSLIEFEVVNLDSKQREELWQELTPDLSLNETGEIANAFQLTPKQIYLASTRAQYLHQFKETQNSLCEEIYKACHNQARQYLSGFAKVINPIHKRDSIILTAEKKGELDDIIDHVKYRHLVYEEGGFNKKLSLGRGLIILLSGTPGTGKTMAAEVIAATLNLILYKIDLSSIVSKYIGETEKQLERIFQDAQSSNAILLFDEADALFGKRGEVENARDNYANIQTSYLLQKVEEYPGIVILTTNLRANMDEAFTRRLHFCVDFPMPKPQERLRIWQNIWPANVIPCSSINFQKLAEELEIAGGSIRNIAVSATFKAAAIQQSNTVPINITPEQLLFAIHKEFRKMGRVIMRDQMNNLLAK